MKIIALLVGALVLAGCRWRSIPIIGHLFAGPEKPTETSTPPGSDKPPGGGDEYNINIIIELAMWATWAGALCWVVAVPIAMWVSKPIAVRIAISGLGLVVSAQILIWVGDHLAWLSAIVLLLTLAAVGWKHRKKIVDQAECITGRNLNGDDMICDKPIDKNLEHG